MAVALTIACVLLCVLHVHCCRSATRFSLCVADKCMYIVLCITRALLAITSDVYVAFAVATACALSCVMQVRMTTTLLRVSVTIVCAVALISMFYVCVCLILLVHFHSHVYVRMFRPELSEVEAH